MKLKPTTPIEITIIDEPPRTIHHEVFEIEEPAGLENFVVHPSQDGISVLIDGNVLRSCIQPAWLVTERRTGSNAGSGDSPEAAVQNLLDKLESRGGIAAVGKIIERNLRRANAQSN